MRVPLALARKARSREIERQGKVHNAAFADHLRGGPNLFPPHEIHRADFVAFAEALPRVMLAGFLDDRQTGVTGKAIGFHGSRVTTMPLPRYIGEPAKTQ